MRSTPFLVEMTFSMTANVKCTLSPSTDSLFAVQVYYLSYPRKHTNCSISLQEHHFPTIASYRKTSILLKLRNVTIQLS